MPNTNRIQFFVDDELFEKIKRDAAADERTISEFVRFLVKNYYSNK